MNAAFGGVRTHECRTCASGHRGKIICAGSGRVPEGER